MIKHVVTIAEAMEIPELQELVIQFIDLARANFAEAEYPGCEPGVSGMFQHDAKTVEPFRRYLKQE